MKRFGIILLILALLLALCACGDTTPAASGELHGKTPAEGELPLGKVTRNAGGTVYENEYLGFGCRLDGWYVADEEQLASLMGYVLDAYSDTAYADLAQDAQVFFDLYAEGPDIPGTINLNFTRAGAPEDMDWEQYLNTAQSQLKYGLEAGGMQKVRTERRTVRFAGVDMDAIGFYAMNQGVDYYGVQLYFTVGGRYAALTLGSFGSDKTEKLLELFYPLG